MRIHVFGHELDFHGQEPMWHGDVGGGPDPEKRFYVAIRYVHSGPDGTRWTGMLQAPRPRREQLLVVTRDSPAECAKAIEYHVHMINEFAERCGLDIPLPPC